jgi:subtilisin family serine protease
MKGRPLPAIALMAALLAVSTPAALAGRDRAEKSAPPASAALESVPGEILVRFRPGVARGGRAEIRRAADVELERALLLPRTQLVETEPGQTVDSAIAELERLSGVRYAEPNFIRHISATPNDPDFVELWGLQNTGQMVNGVTGTAGADIDAPEAWDETTGDPSIVVGVLDTGMAHDHPDLAANVWDNAAESGGTAAVDDDANGFVDDHRGWDFVNDDNDPRDGNDHGTHVSGTVGAVGNNGSAVVGVNWQVSMMPLQVCDAAGGCPSDALVDAMVYAGENGADVANMSLGSPFFSTSEKAAIDAASGTLFVAAAGNSGTNNDTFPEYPCSYTSDNLLCVAASTQSDTKPPFSSFGATSVDLAAPGTNVLSTVPAYDTMFQDDFEGANNWDWVEGVPDSNKWERTAEITPPSGTKTITDSEGANYANNSDVSVTTSAAVDLTGETACSVQFQLRLRTEFGFDFLHVEASNSGSGPFTTLNSFTGEIGSPFSPRSGDLAAFDGDGSVFLRFRLETDESIVEDGAYIDDVSVRCATTPLATDQKFFQGTSMAAPHASGAAALVLADDAPGLSLSKLKTVLINSVDPKSAFATNTVSGGRLNVDRAITFANDNTPPAPFDLVAPPAGATVATLSPTFSWEPSSDTGGSGLMKYQLLIDGALNRDNISSTSTSSTPVAPLTEGAHTWQIRALDGAGNSTDSPVRAINVLVPDPKQVTLAARPRRVEKGDRVTLTAVVSPCQGHEGDIVEFLRRSRKISEKATNGACVAKHRVKVNRTTKFQAISPQQDQDHTAGTSNQVKVRVSR